MTRLASAFAKGRPALVCFITAGDGDTAANLDALDAFQLLCRTEGIIPALEPSHAIAAIVKRAREMPKDAVILANLCGRGDNDIFTVAEALGVEM